MSATTDPTMTMTTREILACHPTGHARAQGREVQVEHPTAGRCWITLADWQAAQPPRTAIPATIKVDAPRVRRRR